MFLKKVTTLYLCIIKILNTYYIKMYIKWFSTFMMLFALFSVLIFRIEIIFILLMILRSKCH